MCWHFPHLSPQEKMLAYDMMLSAIVVVVVVFAVWEWVFPFAKTANALSTIDMTAEARLLLLLAKGYLLKIVETTKMIDYTHSVFG